MKRVEVWGGIECTVNRVGDGWNDQLALSGHADRDDDLDRMAELGIRVWRYPVLWERVAPRGPSEIDWAPVDRRLNGLRERGLEPIAGLLHHGSGPAYTSLLDPEFPHKLADYAAAVARRFPWITRWTPVNEPLSTARFSALDGHWYPHRTNLRDFARALVNQCRGITLAMDAIRAENPEAELVFTEDVCRHFGTPRMQREVAFRNQRRFLAIDLVCGRVRPDHPLHRSLVGAGIPAAELEELAAAPTPPAIIGANYYVTSDRFLDEEPARAPEGRRFMGEDGPYGETEAVRATLDGLVGHRALLEELWRRYHLPVAITEVHLGCTREEQVRWLLEAWDGAQAARRDGVDVRAVTVWGAFGLFGWDQLVVRPGGTYEPGPFDVRSPKPRKTALARVASDLAAGRDPDAPWGGAGWWRRRVRWLDRQPIAVAGGLPGRPSPPPRVSRPLLITGGGAFAREVNRACHLRGLAAVAPGRALDVGDAEALAMALDELRPWAVFHAAGVRDPAHAEREPDRARRLHLEAPARLAAACAERGIRLVLLSSSLVLPAPGPHLEDAPRAPRALLGRVQAEGESRVLGAFPGALILRSGVLVGLDRPDDPVATGLRLLREGRPWTVPDQASVAVASLLAHTALDLLVDAERGVWHVAQKRPLVELAKAAAKLAGLDTGAVLGIGPHGARLVSARGDVVPSCGAWLRGAVRAGDLAPV